MKHTPVPIPEIHPYVTDHGGVVILNGPFPMEQARRVSALCEAAPHLLEVLRKIANISRYPISDPENIAFALETAREIARAALAKVEGKQDRQEEI